MTQVKISRREFLKLAGLGISSAGLQAVLPAPQMQDFPQAERLGRVCHGRWELKARPDYDSPSVGYVYDDEVVIWERDVTGRWPLRRNQRWVETPNGYLWSAYLQPVKNLPNEPMLELPQTSIGPGMWMEVTVPYVNLAMVNPPPRHPQFRWRFDQGFPLRFYYSQVLWIDQVRTTSAGRVEYRINEKYGNRGDIYWADARAFRPITEDELEPISPEVEGKRVVIDITPNRQVLSCFEGDREVYFCRISSGQTPGSTPLGAYSIWRKLVSLHMEGGTAIRGWDVSGVGWTTLFTNNGVAIHSTYWHNNFGDVESNGCVNAAPDDAKWIYRWTSPSVDYDPGELTITDFSATRVHVIQA